ncbi:MAG: flagellar basal body-associated FliL family protein [Rhodobacterales bacterium]|nr:flagellar basal body-associated FliL family protein [Rhodobacterales bacterium]
MLKIVLPVVLLLAGLGGGVGAGLMLQPPPDPGSADPAAKETAKPDKSGKSGDPAGKHGHAEALPFDYVKLSNQFVVPVLEGTRVGSLVVLSLSLEVETGAAEQVYAVEPKLRDVFLRILFDHANAGGFAGAFTDGATLDALRRALFEGASSVLGDRVRDVLIVDLVRQDG